MFCTNDAFQKKDFSRLKCQLKQGLKLWLIQAHKWLKFLLLWLQFADQLQICEYVVAGQWVMYYQLTTMLSLHCKLIKEHDIMYIEEYCVLFGIRILKLLAKSCTIYFKCYVHRKLS